MAFLEDTLTRSVMLFFSLIAILAAYWAIVARIKGYRENCDNLRVFKGIGLLWAISCVLYVYSLSPSPLSKTLSWLSPALMMITGIIGIWFTAHRAKIWLNLGDEYTKVLMALMVLPLGARYLDKRLR